MDNCTTAKRRLCTWELVHNVPLPRVKSDGPWMLHASGDQCGAHISVKLGHLDLVQIAVDPVQFPRYPIHSQALRGSQAMLHDHLDPCHTWDNDINIKTAWTGSTNLLCIVWDKKKQCQCTLVVLLIVMYFHIT